MASKRVNSADTTTKLTRFAPGIRQPAHSHGPAHISFVLAGACLEEVGRTEIDFSAGRVATRPEGMRHAAAFPRGALILTCACATAADVIKTPLWSHILPRERLRKLIPLLLSGEDDATEASWDLLALATHAGPRRSPSPWLVAVRDQLLEEPARVSLSRLAEKAGRHRVHLGRSFLTAFGETPSVFRRRAMLDRALNLAARGMGPAQAAVEAGFTDQSHFNRACRDVFGLAPGRLVRNAVDVAFVQYGRA